MSSRSILPPGSNTENRSQRHLSFSENLQSSPLSEYEASTYEHGPFSVSQNFQSSGVPPGSSNFQSYRSFPNSIFQSAGSLPNESALSRMTNLSCDCAPDFFNAILGPTADEAFLNGFQTLLTVCEKFMGCKKEPEIEAVSALTSIGFTPEMASQIVQTSFAMSEKSKESFQPPPPLPPPPPPLPSCACDCNLPKECQMCACCDCPPRTQCCQSKSPWSIKSLTSQETGMVSNNSQRSSWRSSNPATSQNQSSRNIQNYNSSGQTQVTSGNVPWTSSALAGQSQMTSGNVPWTSANTLASQNPALNQKTKSNLNTQSQLNSLYNSTTSWKGPSNLNLEDPRNVSQKSILSNTRSLSEETERSCCKPKACACCDCEERSYCTPKIRFSDSVRCLNSNGTEEIIETAKTCACCKCDKNVDTELIEYEPKGRCKSMDPCLDDEYCLCCDCYNEKRKDKCSPKDCIMNALKTIKSKFELPTTVRCRCYDCSAPVVYKVGRNVNDCLCSKPKVKCKCGSGRSGSYSLISFEKGDTCCDVDPDCCCD